MVLSRIHSTVHLLRLLFMKDEIMRDHVWSFQVPKYFLDSFDTRVFMASRRRSDTQLTSSRRVYFGKPLDHTSTTNFHSTLVFSLQNSQSVFVNLSFCYLRLFALLNPLTSPTCAISNYKMTQTTTFQSKELWQWDSRRLNFVSQPFAHSPR